MFESFISKFILQESCSHFHPWIITFFICKNLRFYEN